MTVNAGDAAPYPLTNASREKWVVTGTFTFGAAGTISSSVVDDAKVALATDSGTGVHALTYPACSNVRIRASLVSAAGTVAHVIATAISASAGTATLRLSKGGTATQAASGNKLMVRIVGTVTP